MPDREHPLPRPRRSRTSRPTPWQAQWPARWPLQPLPRTQWAEQAPTHQQAQPPLIAAALRRAQQRPSGNWYVFAASRDIRSDRPLGFHVADTELVAWRDTSRRLCVGPGACPHLGAPLAQARVDRGGLRCRWHGLRLDERPQPGWCPLPTHDDGVLAWVRLDTLGGEPPTDLPIIPTRPDNTQVLDAVTTVTGACEPEDIMANRLDPWHGAWFHPYSFARLSVLSAPPAHNTTEAEDQLVVNVTFKAGPGLGIPVTAAFTCTDPRTVVMTILAGEGTGSVVETHATPLGTHHNRHHTQAYTQVTEAILATSERPGFTAARTITPALRPLIRHAATRLWRDDIAYAERRYTLRKKC